MEIEKPLVLKRLSDVAVGELIVIDGENSSCLAVCFRNEPETADVVVGLLDGPDLGWPHLIILNGANKCGSYGTDWFVELIEDENSFPYQGGRFREQYGAIFVSETAVLLFGPNPQGGHRGGSVELPSFAVRGVESDSIPYHSWRIWKSRQAYEDGRRELRTITAKTPPPR